MRSDGLSSTRLELSYSSSRILELLITRADQIVDREEIFAYAWPGRVVGQNSLNQSISSLRDLLGDDEQRSIIQTVPRRGYRFNSAFLSDDEAFLMPAASPAVTEQEGPAGDTLPVLELPAAVPAPGGFSISRLLPFTNYALSALVALLLVGLIWRVDWLLWGQQGMFSVDEVRGDLELQYIAESPEELSQLQTDIKPVSDRLMAFVAQPETVIFNKMHGFYEVVCVDGGETVRFLTVHKSRLSQLSDEQLQRCIN